MTHRTLFPLLLALALSAAANAATDFTLDDQHRKPHARANVFSGRPVIMLAGSQRKTPDEMEAWDKALRVEAPASVRIIGLSNLEGLPFFVPKRSVYRTLVKQFPNTVVLCDWEGDVYRSLGFPKGATISVAVFSGTGERLGIVNGPVSDDNRSKVLGLLQ